MWANLNLKSLQDKFQESLHDLESSLSVATSASSTSTSHPNQPPASTSTPSSSSPARAAAPAPSRISIGSPTRTNSSGSSRLPLSPTSLAATQQSASQLADSALSSLRASLRKGRQSFDAARASLDGIGAPPGLLGGPGPGGSRRTPSMDSISSQTGSAKERELKDRAGKGRDLGELSERDEDRPDSNTDKVGKPDVQLIDISEPEPAKPRPSAPSESKSEEKAFAPADPVEDDGEDEDAWGVSGADDDAADDEPEPTTVPAPTATTDPKEAHVEAPSASRDSTISQSGADAADPPRPEQPLETPQLADPPPASPPKALVNPVLANLKQESVDASNDLTADTPRPSSFGVEPADKGDALDDDAEEDGWDLPEVEAEEVEEAEEGKAGEAHQTEDPVEPLGTAEPVETASADKVNAETAAPSDPSGGTDQTTAPFAEEVEGPTSAPGVDAPSPEPRKTLNPLSEPFTPSSMPSSPIPSSSPREHEETVFPDVAGGQGDAGGGTTEDEVTATLGQQDEQVQAETAEPGRVLPADSQLDDFGKEPEPVNDAAASTDPTAEAPDVQAVSLEPLVPVQNETPSLPNPLSPETDVQPAPRFDSLLVPDLPANIPESEAASGAAAGPIDLLGIDSTADDGPADDPRRDSGLDPLSAPAAEPDLVLDAMATVTDRTFMSEEPEMLEKDFVGTEPAQAKEDEDRDGEEEAAKDKAAVSDSLGVREEEAQADERDDGKAEGIEVFTEATKAPTGKAKDPVEAVPAEEAEETSINSQPADEEAEEQGPSLGQADDEHAAEQDSASPPVEVTENLVEESEKPRSRSIDVSVLEHVPEPSPLSEGSSAQAEGAAGTPLVDFEKSGALDEHVEPELAPPTETQDAEVDQEEEPIVEKEKEPIVEKEDEPTVEKEDEPTVEKEDEPTVEKEDEPTVEKEDEPTVEKEDEPTVAKEDEPIVKTEDEPDVEKEEEAVANAAENDAVEDATRVPAQASTGEGNADSSLNAAKSEAAESLVEPISVGELTTQPEKKVEQPQEDAPIGSSSEDPDTSAPPVPAKEVSTPPEVLAPLDQRDGSTSVIEPTTGDSIGPAVVTMSPSPSPGASSAMAPLDQRDGDPESVAIENLASDAAEEEAEGARPRERAGSVSQYPRFLELKEAHAKLESLRTSLNTIVSSLIPSISTIDDTDALEAELRNLKAKGDMGMDEVKRLTRQLDQQKSRVEELRDTHRLEHQSQQCEIDALRDSLSARNKSLEEANDKLAAAEKSAETTRREIAKASEEYEKLKVVAKEEEEKRIKALSLLRALRQKLVKNEQERGTMDEEIEKARKAEKDALETLKSDRARFDKEIVGLRSAQEAVVAKLKSGFERELQAVKERYEKDAVSKRGQFELDAIHVKSTQAKEIAAKDARIAQLESTVKELTKSRDQVFDEAQVKTEEIEAIRAEEEVLRGRTSEVEYELKEARDRIAALVDELDDVKRSKRDSNRDDSNARKLLAEAEARHEARVRDLEARARQLEKDRHETEEEMGKNMQDRLKEVERMRALLAQKDLDYAESVQNSQKREATIAEAEKAKADLEKRLKNLEEMLQSVKADADKAISAEAAVREELSERLQRSSELEARLEEVQSKESSLRSNNKTLREELRKLQSGVLLSEKQRHPGVGYFSSFNASSSTTVNGNPSSPDSVAPLPSTGINQVVSPTASVTSLASGSAGGLGGTARANGNADEALNFEYLRNVILQFLEKPDMRPHLISVLGVILHFTPAESRRLVAKAGH
ncbi:hypothetical protein JCM10212_001437 [Sporobolomyces blumeae]